ncbi:MAG TPA: hypothetical protein VL093_13455 [Flavipsychrobacter sp.]|jgi:hypothetical protein|nr:hypothetical protein [Flavipsychrobacter sp.]
MLKKIVAISFLFIYLFSTTELSQLLKMPLLIEHFIEHKEENRDITFWQFMHMHYSMDDVKDADYDKDMKLPFKSCTHSSSSVSNVYTPLTVTFFLPQLRVNCEDRNFTSRDQFLQTSFLSNIWQPPRAC